MTTILQIMNADRNLSMFSRGVKIAELEAKLNEADELDRGIIEQFEHPEKQTSEDGLTARDLLYRCDESKWKNLKPGN